LYDSLTSETANHWKNSHSLNGNPLKNLQAKWKAGSTETRAYLIIDEISMLGKSMLYWIDQRLRQISGKNIELGGISVILCCDFGQLNPIGDVPLYAKLKFDDSAKRSMATLLYKLFTSVVFLKTISE
jgi:hypothetical protein